MHDYYCVQRRCWYPCAKNNTAKFSGYNVSHSELAVSSSFSLSEHEPLISLGPPCICAAGSTADFPQCLQLGLIPILLTLKDTSLLQMLTKRIVFNSS